MRSALAIAVALVSVSAFSPGAPAAETTFGGNPSAAFLAAADNNLDGAVDVQEHELFLTRHFALSDRNGDGGIDPVEREAFTWHWGCGCEDGALVGWKPNPDGLVPREEHFRAGQDAFAAWDANGDGAVAGDEIKINMIR